MTTAGTKPTIRPPKHKAPVNGRGSENCLAVGTRLADFEIIEVLGEGGFGIVYLAFDHALRRTVAIKEFMPSVLSLRGPDGAVTPRADRHRAAFRGGLKSFINEARLLAQFDHPALVKVHRFWEQNGTAYTAMQYYEGRTIKDIVTISPGLVDQEWCLKMMGQVLQALEVLYTKQIVHRDVSPDNIIVQYTGEAVLLDFGSAREIIGDMTRAVTVILKPGYAPVEQYANDVTLEQGPYTDIYALCAVVYFAVTRKAPASSIARMVQDPMVPLVTLAPAGYDHAFLAAIDQGLAVLAEDRPRTIPAFRTLLGIAAVEAPVVRPASQPKRFTPPPAAVPATVKSPTSVVVAGRSPPPHVPYTSPFAPETHFTPVPTRHRVRWAAALGALVALAGVAVYLNMPQSRDDTIKMAVSEPRRITVTARDIAGAEDILPVSAAALVMPTASARSVGSTASSGTAAAGPDAPNSTATDNAAAVAAPATDAAAAPAPAAQPMAPLTLGIKPWGTVYIDGHERGISPPMKRLMLPAGTHTVRIVNPIYPAYTTTITLKKNGAAAIEHDFGVAPP